MTNPLIVLALAALSYGAVGEPLTVRLLTNVPSPQPVGTAIGLFPRVENATKGMLVFRYSVSVGGGPLHVIRDFSQQRDFVWSPALYEHEASVHVTVRNNDTKETAEGELTFRTTSRIKGSSAAIAPTSHPLVTLFSAPPCQDGGKFRAAFQRQGDKELTYTPFEACRGSRSNNV